MRCKFIAICTATDSPSTSAETGLMTSYKQSVPSFDTTLHTAIANNVSSKSVSGCHRNHLRPLPAVAASTDRSAHLISAFAVFNLLMTFHVANGYVIGRLLTLQHDEFPGMKNYMFTPLNKSVRDGETEMTNVRLARDIWGAHTKITPEMFYEALNDIVTNSVNAESVARRRRSKMKKPVTATSYSLRDTSAISSADINSSNTRKNVASLELSHHNYPRDLRDLQIKRATQKKSSLKSLKKFSSNSARNCFFTPIQCMIHHDMSKYKKLIENNSDSFTTTKMH